MTEATHTGPAGQRFIMRPLRGLPEYRACVDLQHATWGAGFSENVPVVMLMVSQRLGGVAAGAFDDQNALVGFVFGVTGVEDGVTVHWSDMLAVLPEHRNTGLGLALKSYQRSRMLDIGVGRIYWTFDPLQSKNAWLNMGRLGAVSSEYVVNMYGESDSPLHAGIGTDRLVVRWEIATDRVVGRLGRTDPIPSSTDVDQLPTALGAETGDGQWPEPLESAADHVAEAAVTVAVPADIDALKAAQPELAREWRARTRGAFRKYLDAGFEVRELVRGNTVSRYVLGRCPLETESPTGA